LLKSSKNIKAISYSHIKKGENNFDNIKLKSIQSSEKSAELIENIYSFKSTAKTLFNNLKKIYNKESNEYLDYKPITSQSFISSNKPTDIFANRKSIKNKKTLLKQKQCFSIRSNYETEETTNKISNSLNSDSVRAIRWSVSGNRVGPCTSTINKNCTRNSV